MADTDKPTIPSTSEPAQDAAAYCEELYEKQDALFSEGVSYSRHFRTAMLDMLEAAVLKHQTRLGDALFTDLGKSFEQAFASEIGFVLKELRHLRRHLASWMKPRGAALPLFQWPARGGVHPTPFGISLVISPWNYPVQLSLAPLCASVSAGNTVVLKPSELAPATAAALADMLGEYFSPEFIAVVPGGAEISKALVEARPDHLFFTGSTKVGREIQAMAARELIPTVLELGGKNPCLILPDADLAVSARRIVWGKFLNAGQTCVAPDYVLVPRPQKRAFVEALESSVKALYGSSASGRGIDKNSPDYGRLCSQRHYDRLVGLLDGGTILFGGEGSRDERYLEPTLVDVATWNSPLMDEEIFGPVLPILSYDDVNEVLSEINSRPKPLSFYVFSGDVKFARSLVARMHCGGGAVNDTVVQISASNLPFGGVGTSGMGRYHGYAGFKAFSYEKSILVNTTKIDVPYRYPPYEGKIDLIKRFMS